MELNDKLSILHDAIIDLVKRGLKTLTGHEVCFVLIVFDQNKDKKVYHYSHCGEPKTVLDSLESTINHIKTKQNELQKNG